MAIDGYVRRAGRVCQRKPAEEYPSIEVNGRHMRDITADALNALHLDNTPEYIFRRSNTLTRINLDEAGRPYTEALSEAAFRGCLDRCCNFVRVTTNRVMPVSPPVDVVSDGLTRPDEWQFPALLGITEAPVLRPNGTVLNKPGYDSMTTLYFQPAPGLVVPPIPDRPTDSQVQDAIELAVEPLADFPFDSEASCANAIGTMFAPILRPMIDGPVPLALFDKPQHGTGASLLAEVISIIATGRAAAMMTAQKDDEGWKKTITSLLLKGQLVGTIDNVEGDLWAPSLAALLTLNTWQDRILGQSRMVELPHRTVWIATGNNIRLRGDLPRRCIWIRMDAHVARPWLRDRRNFKHADLTKWLANNRGAILAAILTIARAWVIAGTPEPQGLPILGGYEDYCRVIGSLSSFMGIKGFLTNLDAMYNETDTETPQWEGFLATWDEVIGSQEVTAAELISYIHDHQDLRAALPDTIADVEARNYSVRLGQRLTKRKNVHYQNDLVLTKAGEKKRAVTWKVVRFESAITSPKFSFAGEVGEVDTTLAHENNDTNLYESGVHETSPTSPLDTKKGEVAVVVTPADCGSLLAPQTDFICGNCGGKNSWLGPGNQQCCSRCHPKPGGD